MQFKECFDVNRFLFNPEIFYSGEWLLEGTYLPYEKNNILANNSLYDGKISLYKKFLEGEFYKPLSMIYNSKSMVRGFTPKIVFDVSDLTNRRSVSFSHSIFLLQQIYSLEFVEKKGFSSIVERYASEISPNGDKESEIAICKDYFREELRVYRDVQSKGRNSKYYVKMIESYNLYLNSTNLNFNFDEFIQMRIDVLTKFNVRTKDCLAFFNKSINTDKLLSAFDYDKFCLIAANGAIKNCYTTEEIEGKLSNSLSYVKYYVDAVFEFRKRYPKYNPSINTVDKKSRKIKLTFDSIYEQYNLLLSRHPEFGFYSFDSNKISSILKRYNVSDDIIENFDISEKNSSEVLDSIIELIREDKTLTASWEFIPRGKIEKASDLPETETKNNTSGNRLTMNESTRRMVIGRNFIEAECPIRYIYKLKGINKFVGYQGYIYPNGAVIFEKYYENEKKLTIAKGNATYVMNIYNFFELSRLNKMELINMLKNDKSLAVKRIFHREDMEKWKQEVIQSITGTDYSFEIELIIDGLLNDSALDNLNKKIKK